MKKGEQPEFATKWWKSRQPNGLNSADKLEDAQQPHSVIKHLDAKPFHPVAKVKTLNASLVAVSDSLS